MAAPATPAPNPLKSVSFWANFIMVLAHVAVSIAVKNPQAVQNANNYLYGAGVVLAPFTGVVPTQPTAPTAP